MRDAPLARLATLGVICSLTLSGCSSAPPPPGQKVDIGGLALHLNCTGPQDAQPTVIIEAGLGEMSSTYQWVQAGVSQQARVCSYDRAGLGWSDSSSEPRDAEHMVHELHALLAAAHVAPPYVLAGHSLGGLLILSQFKDEWFDELPPDVQATYEYFVGDPRTYATGRAELGYFDGDANDAALVESLGERPVVVLTAGQLRKHSNPKELAHAQAYLRIFSELHAQYAGLSSRGRQVILPKATHMSLVYDKRNAEDVVKNILEVVQES